ncbi:conserved hypothetical protein [Hymenobacter roseosalivarius DSM 11622]|uniref:Uncharacterized protein n=1 Tax=Hymenobacter roseosalivarius DSM 11622 TaxID=645990 RepID=A0A1W1W1F4_9BACT|nr:hypothetical protein [Hymenobacter roseosalivarius]SMB99447.1 conserved hypothetical protein [Hymenobacter roseosalivarius DSM 11622]
MKKSLLHILAAGILVAACSPATALAQKAKTVANPAAAVAQPAGAVPLAALFITYSEEQARLFPLEGIYLGDNRYNNQLPNDQTRAFRQQQRQSYGQYLATLHKVDRTKL